MPTYLLDLTAPELGAISGEIGHAAAELLPGVREADARRAAEDILFSRCTDRAGCSRAGSCQAGEALWSLTGARPAHPGLCLGEREVDDLPWIFACAVIDRGGIPAVDRVRTAGILRALFRAALAPRLHRAEGCPRA